MISVRGRILEEPSELDGSLGLCELTIADNGVGFEQKHAERIFGTFERLHGRNEYEGTGIGPPTAGPTSARSISGWASARASTSCAKPPRSATARP